MGICQKKKRTQLPDPHTIGVEEALKVYYKEKVLPVEKRHDFIHFGGPPLDDAEFTAKPAVLLVGQYSVGKTSMVKFLLGREYPGARIGPEPTTDQFVVIVKSDVDERRILGNTLVTEATFPYKSLAIFGNAFLSKLLGATCNSTLLDHLILIDTPGILSGEKQRIARGYDFEAVIRFMAHKVDRIILLFDVSKLDISDEFKVVIEALRGNEEKVKIVLNKADDCKLTELNRVRGALMYNLGRILTFPEIPRVFIGSFWDGEVKNKEAFRDDYKGLLKDLIELPKTVKMRKINDLAKRAKQAKVHALLMDELIRGNSLLCASGEAGRKAAAKEKALQRAYAEVALKHRINRSDFPDTNEFQQLAATSDARRWKMKDEFDMEYITEFIDEDVTKIMAAHPPDAQQQEAKLVGAALDSGKSSDTSAEKKKTNSSAKEKKEKKKSKSEPKDTPTPKDKEVALPYPDPEPVNQKSWE